MNQQAMMKIRKMQKEMEQAQKKLEETVFTGTSGGVVTIKMTGDKKVVSVSIDKEAIESAEDVEMLEDILVVAFNDCTEQIDNENQKITGPLASMLPGGFF